MEKDEHLERWVQVRMTASEVPPQWPDAAAGWRHLEHRLTRRPRRAALWVATAAAACVAVLAYPPSRITAQRFWDEVVLGRIQVLTTDFERHGAAASFVSLEMQVRTEADPVSSLEEASRVAGFTPRLPQAGVFTVAPAYSVTDVMSARLQLRTPAIRYLLAQAGGSSSEVPDAWNGVVLEARVGPIVVADYNGVLLLQSLPFRLIKPVDFDLELFYRIAFQSIGMNEDDARALSADAAISPALLMVMPKEERDLVHEFRTKSGTGMMIEEVYGPGKIAALWSGADRLYALFPASGEISREFVIKVANALE
jgi:hypothetical protein